MKNILITGANSYVGTSFEKWLSQWPDKYHVDTIDMIDGTWREKSFKGYDVVFHVAGVAHKKEARANAHIYYEINRDLAIETAKKAKADRVHQFIFMSTMAVYGRSEGIISDTDLPAPRTYYAKAKYQAEGQIQLLSDDNFLVAILRPPMIYGKNCPGNYQRLRNFILKYRVFPDVKNTRSILQINNLSAYVQKCIDMKIYGAFYPQDPNYACTRDIAMQIAHYNGIKIFVTPVFNIIRFIPIDMVEKVLGSLYYKDIDEWSREGTPFPYSVALSEKGYMESQ